MRLPFNIKINKTISVVILFVFLVLYNLIFTIKEIIPVQYGFYLVDYSVGFCTKILPGAIYNAVFSNLDAVSIRIYTMGLFYIFLIGVSICAIKHVTSFNENLQFPILIIVLFFLFGMSSVSFCGAYLEMLDVYWWYFALLALIFIRNKYLKWCIPLLLVLSIFVHLASAIFIVPLFIFILLLENSAQSKKNALNGIIVVSLVLSIIFVVYFILFEEKNLLMSINEFHDFISKRNVERFEDVTFYYDYSLYKTYDIDGNSLGTSEKFSEYVLFDSENVILRFFNTLYSQFFITVNIYKSIKVEGLTKLIIASLPIIVFLYRYGIITIKNNKNRRARVFALLGALVFFPIEYCTLLLFSPDIERWFAHTLTALFMVMLYDMYIYKDISVSRNKKYDFFIIIYFMFYAFFAVKYIA